MAVAIWPGATAFTVMSYAPSSSAGVAVSPCIPALAAGVVRLAPITQCRTAGQGDDPAVALGDHVLLRRLGAVEDAGEVHREHRLPIILGQPEEQVVAGDPGIVDQDVRTAKLLRDRREDLAHRGTVGDIADVGRRLPARRDDPLDRVLGRFTIEDRDPRTLGGQT